MKARYIVITIIVIAIIFIGIPCIQSFVITPIMVKQAVNSVMDERLSEITVNTSQEFTPDESTDSSAVTSYQEFTPNESTDSSAVTSYQEFTPDESIDSSAVTSYQEFTPNESTDSSTVTSYQESTPDESTDSSTSAPEPIYFTAKIANTRKSNGKPNPTPLQVFQEEREAFDNAKYLKNGRYVSIQLSTNSEVKEISSKISMHNPETDLFEDYASCDFEVSNAINFEILKNPHVGYNGNFVRCVIVVTVVTEDGTFYLGCSY